MRLSLTLLACSWSWLAGDVAAVRINPFTGELVGLDERPPERGNYLPPPSKDVWYRAPDGWEQSSPGDVLKVRPHAHPTINIRNCIDTFQVLFRTTDTHDRPSWAVSTVFIPKSHKNCNATNLEDCSHGVVSYQVPTDSVDVDAAPSYLLQARDPYGEIRDLLARRWIVAVPDYDGLYASFCAGVQSGHATLDGGRAVMKVAGQFGLRMDKAKYALWGYSGGAFATEFAAELAGSYAPDFKIAGVVVGGGSVNLTTTSEHMNNGSTTGLVVAGMIGITTQQPDARKYLLSRIKQTGPYNITSFTNVTTMTGMDALTYFFGQDVYKYFIGGRDDWLHPVMQQVYQKDAYFGRHGVPNMPCFYYTAIQDEMSPVEDTDALVNSYCKQGANILYHRNTVGHHNDELWSGRLRTYAYLAAVLDGAKPYLTIPEKGCLTQNWP